MAKARTPAAAPPLPPRPRDEVATRLIEMRVLTSDFLLDLNRALTAPHNVEYGWPWNLPSRLFQFPIEVGALQPDGQRSLALKHPKLAEHPFVQQIAEGLGRVIDCNRGPGLGRSELGNWHHAIDLIGKWPDLLKTREFTDDTAIAGAVRFGLSYGEISTKDARTVMAAIGADEPSDLGGLLLAVSEPHALVREGGVTDWPVNYSVEDGRATAWAMLIGIERGWFKHDRSGHLNWTQAGRDRHAGGSADTYAESKTGQLAFDF